jgi:hypothetical protein
MGLTLCVFHKLLGPATSPFIIGVDGGTTDRVGPRVGFQ